MKTTNANVQEGTMKELRILCLAVVVVAGILNAGAAVFAGQHPAVAMDLGQRTLAANP
jgi:hypothetical protein